MKAAHTSKRFEQHDGDILPHSINPSPNSNPNHNPNPNSVALGTNHRSVGVTLSGDWMAWGMA